MLEERKAFYSTKELAGMIGVSEWWVETYRHRIYGAKRIGRLWRFEKAVIDARISREQDLLRPENGKRKFSLSYHKK
jgi:hypothetical protein